VDVGLTVAVGVGVSGLSGARVTTGVGVSVGNSDRVGVKVTTAVGVEVGVL